MIPFDEQQDIFLKKVRGIGRGQRQKGLCFPIGNRRNIKRLRKRLNAFFQFAFRSKNIIFVLKGLLGFCKGDKRRGFACKRNIVKCFVRALHRTAGKRYKQTKAQNDTENMLHTLSSSHKRKPL